MTKPITFIEHQRRAGMAGKGKAKERSKAHYQEMARRSAATRRANKEAQKV